MGGKTSQSTQQTTIPAQVLAQYQSVNNRADATANTPFQTYGTAGTATSADYANGNTGTFVAPINSTQQTGIAGTTAAANEAQPAYASAIAGTQASSAPISGQQINQYLSPYLQDVVGSESALLNQNNQQQQAGQLGTAISSGAFGGDRTGIAAANLAQQQNLSNANIYSGLLNQGYNTALSTAQQEQQIGLAGANQLGSLGSGAQTAALQGAGAELQAGTVAQQTQQAQDTAQYNQFEQQQSYPFQVDQFLANIAEGTGALSGSTTTTTQPGGFFSDERLKDDKKPIGKTYDGQTIYSYKMKGDPRTRIGLIAQEVEEKHPKAVGIAAGYKTVDYAKATQKSANDGHFYRGGVVRKASGGTLDAYDLASLLDAQQQMYAGLGKASGSANTPHGGTANVPAPSSVVGHLSAPSGGLKDQPTGLQNVNSLAQLAKSGQQIYNAIPSSSSNVGVSSANLSPSDASWSNANFDGSKLKRGGRAGYDAGGLPYSGGLDIPDDTTQRQLQTLSGNNGKTPPSGINDLAQLASIASMFLKTGGRIGKDDGGGADDSELPEQEVDAKKPDPVTYTGGIAPVSSTEYVDQPTLPSAQNESAGSSWWDRNKGNVIPALEGLAAMGTAPTKHLGVALAAGLGAGAGAYVPTQEGLAKADLTSQQAKAANIANQSSQLSLDQYKQAVNSTAALPQPIRPSGMSQGAADDPQEVAFNRYAPLPTALPPEVTQKQLALTYGGKSDAAKAVGEQYTNAVTNAIQARQLRANADYQNYAATANAEPNRAYAKLVNIDPQKAQQLAQTTPPDQLDAAARDYSQKMAYQSHQYSGRPTDFKNGVMIDSQLNQPVVGSQQLMTGVPQEHLQELWNEGLQPVTLGNNLPGFKYQAAGYKTNEQYFNAQRAAALQPNNQVNSLPQKQLAQNSASPPTVPTSNGVSNAPRVSNSTAVPTTTPNATSKAASNDAYIPIPGARQATGAPAVIPKTVSPELQKALADPEFKLPPLPRVDTVTTREAALKQQDIDMQNANKLKTDADAATRAASTAQQYIKAAQAVMASKGAPVTGSFGGIVRDASALVGGLDATNYQVVAKNLSNAAIQAGAAIFPGSTDSKVSLTLNDMNPSVKNTPDALRELLDTNLRSTEYTLDTANKVPLFLQSGGDAGNFDKWNQKYNNRATAVNAGLDTSGTKEGTVTKSKSGKDIIYLNGHWQYKQ